jgi:serine protease Do
MMLGNTGGSSVVTGLDGRRLGLGPDRLEVSAEFIPGNSGSPIVQVTTGCGIGIATSLTQRHEEFAGAPRGPRAGEMVVRRFGDRIDTAKKWESVNWPVFQSDAAQLRKIPPLMGDVCDFLDALRE